MTRRPVLQAIVAVVVVLGASWTIFRRTLYKPQTAQQAGGSIVLEQHGGGEARVVAVVGDVQRTAPGGTWRHVVVGERLRADDSLRTTAGARTDLSVGERSRLTVAESSQVTLRELTDKVHRIRVARGRIAVDYQPDGNRVLRIESDGSDAVAETRAARFSVLSSGTAVAIATESGDVDLTARNKTVRLSAGSQALAMRGSPPSPAEPISARLLLKVANAVRAQEDDLCAQVEGVATRGTEVLVDGVAVALDAEGHFRTRVARSPGKKQVRIVERDAAGNAQERSVPCTEPPRIKDFAIRWRKSGGPP